mmetsp:Transcript_25305/g.58771  ORF Transcript_25305/g.58771 Transcript_25305/m.58771 type:complete len:282 (+) Transcript_25305:402-1247(+)
MWRRLVGVSRNARQQLRTRHATATNNRTAATIAPPAISIPCELGVKPTPSVVDVSVELGLVDVGKGVTVVVLTLVVCFCSVSEADVDGLAVELLAAGLACGLVGLVTAAVVLVAASAALRGINRKSFDCKFNLHLLGDGGCLRCNLTSRASNDAISETQSMLHASSKCHCWESAPSDSAEGEQKSSHLARFEDISHRKNLDRDECRKLFFCRLVTASHGCSQVLFAPMSTVTDSNSPAFSSSCKSRKHAGCRLFSDHLVASEEMILGASSLCMAHTYLCGV